ncbi:MAG TPA: hypothetical protein VHM01_11235 [Alphaproteobacteria bacterium]|nr:hypothetical protein [Alphaproteobacteria bacterium]
MAVALLAALLLTAPAAAQDVISIRNGESVDLGAVYWQYRCESIFLRFYGIDLLEGPPGLSLSIRPGRVWAQRQNCPRPLDGGTVVLTAKDVKERFEGTIHYRVRYDTKDGDKQSTHSRKIVVFP